MVSHPKAGNKSTGPGTGKKRGPYKKKDKETTTSKAGKKTKPNPGVKIPKPSLSEQRKGKKRGPYKKKNIPIDGIPVTGGEKSLSGAAKKIPKSNGKVVATKVKKSVKLITTKMKKSGFVPRLQPSVPDAQSSTGQSYNSPSKPARNAKAIAETLLAFGSSPQKEWANTKTNTKSEKPVKRKYTKRKPCDTSGLGIPNGNGVVKKKRGRPKKHVLDDDMAEMLTIKPPKGKNAFKHSSESNLKEVGSSFLDHDSEDDDVTYMLVDSMKVKGSTSQKKPASSNKPIKVLCESRFNVDQQGENRSQLKSVSHCKPSIVKPVPRIPISPYTRSPSSVKSSDKLSEGDSPFNRSVRRVTRTTGGTGSRSCTPSLLPINPSPVKHIATIAGDYSGRSSVLSPVQPVNLSDMELPAHTKRKSAAASSDTSSQVERRLSVRQTESAFKYKEIVVKKMYNFTQVILSGSIGGQGGLNPQTFNELTQVINSAKYDDSRLLVLTGSGNTFTTGLDLSYLTTGDVKAAAENMADSLSEFVHAMIMFPKPIVAAVNGQATGCGVAILPLCDIVYASDKATFFTPYTQLGQTPEACLSCTLPQVIGMALANEMMLAGRMLTALEAYQMGLVAQVFWPTSMMGEVTPRLVNMAACSGKVLNATKSLIRSQQKERLLATNQTEAKMLADIWPTPECQRSMKAFLEHRCDIIT